MLFSKVFYYSLRHVIIVLIAFRKHALRVLRIEFMSWQRDRDSLERNWMVGGSYVVLHCGCCVLVSRLGSPLDRIWGS